MDEVVGAYRFFFEAKGIEANVANNCIDRNYAHEPKRRPKKRPDRADRADRADNHRHHFHSETSSNVARRTKRYLTGGGADTASKHVDTETEHES